MLLALAVSTARAQQRIPCIRNIPTDVSRTRGLLGYPSQGWDPQKVYRQPVVLISFEDRDFIKDDPVAYYQQLMNERGYNEGYGIGSVADYFRDQSNGLFNLQFDIYGPFKVDAKAKGTSKSNYGDDAMKKAMTELRAAVDADFSVYDWDGNGKVDQVIFITAGFTGNQVTGYIWPNTSHANLKAPGDIYVDMASISCELWKDSTSCGIGTICHEFAHCLGLPDIYPAGISVFSVVDDWDLMDGGNYINKGWCPPNLSTMEKMLLGWTTPTELDATTTVTGMKPVSEGGETYIIRNSGKEDEFYLLENRSQTGWDYGIPGQGLAIFHVDYDREIWSSNIVNNNEKHFRYDLFHADGKVYADWDPANDGKDMNKYTMDDWLRNRYLSTSVYPYADSQVVNQSLTDESDPVATVFTANADAVKLMSKPITNIQMAEDGTISFDFMATAAVRSALPATTSVPVAWYDLNGRRLSREPQAPGIYIIRYSNGKTKKIII